MEGDKEFFFKHVAPAAGCVVTFGMFASPLTAVLQDLNLVPFVLTVANCSAWLAYAFVSQNLYVFLSNQPGLLLGFYSLLSCFTYAEQQVRDRLMSILLFFAYLLSLVGCITALGIQTTETSITVWGYTGVAILLLFYGSPLSVMAEVIKTQSSSKINMPMAVMNTVNAMLWLCYGWAIGDSFIWGPNAIGAVLGFIQLGLLAMFSRKDAPKKPSGSDDEEMIKQRLVDSISTRA